MWTGFIKFCVTFCYVGCIKIMPGTFGSLVAFPLIWGIAIFIAHKNIELNIPGFYGAEQEILTIMLIIILVTIILFFIGSYLSDLYIRTHGIEDPREIVIDEVVGQMIVCVLTYPGSIIIHYTSLKNYISDNIIDLLFIFILPFVLFRIFDIVKPWPINWLDSNIKGGIGVMLDDVAAALLASISLYAIIAMF